MEYQAFCLHCQCLKSTQLQFPNDRVNSNQAALSDLACFIGNLWMVSAFAGFQMVVSRGWFGQSGNSIPSATMTSTPQQRFL